MVGLIEEGTDDIEILLNMAFAIQGQEIESPPIKEIMTQLDQVTDSNVRRKGEKMSEFVK